MLDVHLVSSEAALREKNQIAELKYVYFQNLQVNTTPSTNTNKYVFTCSICSKKWYKS